MSMNRLGFRSLMLVSFSLLTLWTMSGIALLDDIQIIEPADNEKARVIRVLIRTGTESSALRQIAEPFTQASGIKVEFVELGRDNFFTAIGTQLFAGSEAFDVMFMPNTSIAQFASANAILPLDPFIENAELTDLNTFDLDDFLSISRYEGAVYALPTDISTHFLYYRSDLIPHPPETWDEFYAVAERFTRSITPESPTMWGATMPAVVPEERSKIFASLLWSFGGDIMREDTGQVMLDLEPSIRAGNYLRKLMQNNVIPADLLTWDFARTRDALLSGEVAMAAPYWNASYQDIAQSTSRYKDDLRIALIPGIEDEDGIIRRATFEHSWTLAINANSVNPVDAWKFLQYATGTAGGKIYVEAGGIPARRSILSDERYRASRPDFGLLLESLRMARNEPYVPYYNALVEIEERALAKILTLHSTPESAFRSAADELRHLYQSIQINRAKQSKYHPKNNE